MQVLNMNEIEQVNGGMKSAGEYAVYAGAVVVGTAAFGLVSYGVATYVVTYASVQAVMGATGAGLAAKAGGLTAAAIAVDAYTDLLEMGQSYLCS